MKDDATRTHIADILQSTEYDVHHLAKDHQGNLDILKHEPDLLLLDQHLLDKDDEKQIVELNAVAAAGC